MMSQQDVEGVNVVALDLARRLLAGTSYVIIPKEQADALKEADALERPWNLVEFAQWTGHGPKWVKEHILYVPSIKAKIDQASGGWIKYATANGSPWVIPVRVRMRRIENSQKLRNAFLKGFRSFCFGREKTKKAGVGALLAVLLAPPKIHKNPSPPRALYPLGLRILSDYF